MSEDRILPNDVSAEGTEAAAPQGPGTPAAEAPPFQMPEAILAEKDQEIGLLKDRLLRLQAEFDNFKKRQTRERAEFLKFAHEGLLRDLLPVLDNLERARASATDGASPAALREGFELILRLFRTTVEKAGVTAVACDGKPFDPNLMQAVAQMEVPDGVDNMVVEVAQQGYLLEGRVLRPAVVTVSRGGRPAATPTPAGDAE
jgi:molecular chaperone GrpE